MTEATCMLCGTNAHARALYPKTVSAADLTAGTFSARRMPDRLHETILRCHRCGLVYPQYLLDSALLARLYHGSSYTYGDEEPFIAATYRRYLARLLPLLSSQPRPLQYLDIGAGNGFMLKEALALGFDQVAGIEPSADAIARADADIRPLLCHGLFSPEVLPGQHFDAISCFQTLDHIQDPLVFVTECHRRLKTGGSVLFINHDIGSLTARLLGKRCPMIDIEHTYLHTKHTMRMLFERCGFSDIQVFSVRNAYPLSYWCHLLPLAPALKRKVLPSLKRSALGRLVVPLYAGNLGLIARRST